jgi:hypothetical protein
MKVNVKQIRCMGRISLTLVRTDLLYGCCGHGNDTLVLT